MFLFSKIQIYRTSYPALNRDESKSFLFTVASRLKGQICPAEETQSVTLCTYLATIRSRESLD